MKETSNVEKNNNEQAKHKTQGKGSKGRLIFITSFFSIIAIVCSSILLWNKPDIIKNVKPVHQWLLSVKSKLQNKIYGNNNSNDLQKDTTDNASLEDHSIDELLSQESEESDDALTYNEFMEMNRKIYGNEASYKRKHNPLYNPALTGFFSKQSLPITLSLSHLEGETDNYSLKTNNYNTTGWLPDYGYLSTGSSYSTLAGISMDTDYWLPVWQSDKSILYSQAGGYFDEGQEMIGLGLGYRYTIDNYMVGTHGFIEQDILTNLRQASIGLEVATSTFKLSSNYYTSIGDWAKPDIKNRPRLEEKLASSWDVGVAYIPSTSDLTASLTYTRWSGGLIDYAGNFTGSLPSLSSTGLLQHPEELNLSLDWQPIPLFGAELSHSLASGDEQDTQLNFVISWQVGESLQKQLQPNNTESQQILQRFKRSMAERQKKKRKVYKNTQP